MHTITYRIKIYLIWSHNVPTIPPKIHVPSGVFIIIIAQTYNQIKHSSCAFSNLVLLQRCVLIFSSKHVQV